MKKTMIPLLLSALMVLLFQACNKDVKEAKTPYVIDAATLSLIKSKGFRTTDVQRTEGGYLVEGDILLTDADLASTPTTPNLLIAQEEQYHTFNLVNTGSGSRTIRISTSGNIGTALSAAIDGAIARYNAENLALKFSRVATGGDINIRLVNTRQYIASAGFPTATGNPHNEIKYANAYANFSSGFMTTVIAHEIGHCIGFRHTDYMNRAYSCGGSASNEGSGSVGAIHIPGPTGPDPNSWMLACLSSTTNRPFNNNDKTALNYLY